VILERASDRVVLLSLAPRWALASNHVVQPICLAPHPDRDLELAKAAIHHVGGVEWNAGYAFDDLDKIVGRFDMANMDETAVTAGQIRPQPAVPELIEVPAAVGDLDAETVGAGTSVIDDVADP
jgi:hypothetical protein